MRTAGAWPGADWYPDPSGRALLRYWDGETWTANVRTERGLEVDPVDSDVLEELRVTGGDLRAPWPPGTAAIAMLAFLGADVAALLARYVTGRLGGGPLASLATVAVTLYGTLLVTAVLVHRRLGEKPFRQSFGLVWRWSDISWGFVVSLIARFCSVVVVLPIVLLFRDAEGSNLPSADAVSDLGVFIALAIVVVLVAPLVEELYFRGLIQRSLETRLPAVGAIAIASALFGLAHIGFDVGRGSVALALATGIGGAVFGVAAHLNRRIGVSIVAHAFFNLIPIAVLWAARPG